MLLAEFTYHLTFAHGFRQTKHSSGRFCVSHCAQPGDEGLSPGCAVRSVGPVRGGVPCTLNPF